MKLTCPCASPGLLGLAALLLVSRATLAVADEPYATVDVDAVAQMLGSSDVRVFDVNPSDVYEKNHLPGAIHAATKQLAALLPSDRSTRLVFYCAGPK